MENVLKIRPSNEFKLQYLMNELRIRDKICSFSFIITKPRIFHIVLDALEFHNKFQTMFYNSLHLNLDIDKTYGTFLITPSNLKIICTNPQTSKIVLSEVIALNSILFLNESSKLKLKFPIKLKFDWESLGWTIINHFSKSEGQLEILFWQAFPKIIPSLKLTPNDALCSPEGFLFLNPSLNCIRSSRMQDLKHVKTAIELNYNIEIPQNRDFSLLTEDKLKAELSREKDNVPFFFSNYQLTFYHGNISVFTGDVLSHYITFNVKVKDS